MAANALFLGTAADEKYVPHLKHMFNGKNTYVYLGPCEYLVQLKLYCQKREITAVVSTNTNILAALLTKLGSASSPKLSNYEGSLFEFDGIEIVFINPLKQLFSVKYGKHVAERFISKVTAPASWPTTPVFQWLLLTPTNFQETYERYSTAFAIAVDIETFASPPSIRCISYTAIFIDSAGTITTHTCVFPIDSMFNLAWMRKFNELPVDKIFQNGKYDVSYLLRYNAYPTQWYWDTINFAHCENSELPKDLAFIAAYNVRKMVYWKDLKETGDLFEYYKYNGLDSWATAITWIAQLRRIPAYACHNYTLEFPLVYPCLLAEMTGILRDMTRLEEERVKLDNKIDTEVTSLRKILSLPGFNTNSPQQVKCVLKLLGCGDIESTEEDDLKKAAYRHPLNGLILEKILNVRGWRKLASTYLRKDSDDDGTASGNGGAEFGGRILAAFNPHGTDTGRLASKKHHFWCGLQLHNIPTGAEVKRTLKADPGFHFAEADLKQAESWDLAHISGDSALIAAVTGPRDFHAVNAAAFFGVPYDKIYDDVKKKAKDKPLRDLSKRTNHGAGYNMGPDVMVSTMGLEKVWEAKKLLRLAFNSPREITKYLLGQFHKTYSGIKGNKDPYAEGTYYAAVAREVATSKKLVSRAFHHTRFNESKFTPENYIKQGGWTRHCFGNPEKSKPDLNSYVAHCPQSLNSRTLNEGYMRVFYEVALPNPYDFRLFGQIHDSIPFAYRVGCFHLAQQVKEAMEIPVTVLDVHGVYRKFTVPCDLKSGTPGTPSTYWNETE